MGGQNRSRHRTGQDKGTKRPSTGKPKIKNSSDEAVFGSRSSSNFKNNAVDVNSSTMIPSDWSPGLYTALKALLSARLCAAIWSVISDCDETFNYWEPTHFLVYGWGQQTWEYSPQYALRSYFYILLHATPAYIYDTFMGGSPVMVFFFIRCMLGLMCAASELYLYSGVISVFGASIGRNTLCLLVFSSGMFISSTAYLPSSFAMYCMACATGAWLHRQYQLSILFVALGALLGWPFAALYGIPIAYDIVFRRRKPALFFKWCGISAVVILMPMVQVDTAYFGRLVVAPLNILLYNVFTSHGPDLYGTEPTSFYFINGLLNFNIAFVLALLVIPTYYMLRKIEGVLRITGYSNVPSQGDIWLIMAPLFLWLVVFVLQPHKEERFLFPIYPLICLAAAITIDFIQRSVIIIFTSIQWRQVVHLCSYISVVLLTASTALSVSRIVAQYRAYHAPMEVFLELQRIGQSMEGDAKIRVCMGKEWYRYPSSFFLPDYRWELSYIESEFKGQLPQPYLPVENASSVVRLNFNDLNKEETDRYVAVESCDFLIDQDSASPTGLEPMYSSRSDTWQSIVSVPFLDSVRSPRLLRAFYIPFLTDHQCSYNDYHLLRNINKKRLPSRSRSSMS